MSEIAEVTDLPFACITSLEDVPRNICAIRIHGCIDIRVRTIAPLLICIDGYTIDIFLQGYAVDNAAPRSGIDSAIVVRIEIVRKSASEIRD